MYSSEMIHLMYVIISFYFNDTATTEIYTLSLHDALPILPSAVSTRAPCFSHSRSTIAAVRTSRASRSRFATTRTPARSEEHTSELQSLAYLVCRLLLEKKKKL